MIQASVSIVIPLWNGLHYIANCLDSVFDLNYPRLEVIVVDNASTDGSGAWVTQHYPQVKVLSNSLNLGFGGGCNVGMRAAEGDVVILLNQDVMVRDGWLQSLVDRLGEEDVGAVGSKLLEPDGLTLSHAGGYVSWPLGMGAHFGIGEIDQGQYDVARDVDYVTGASLAIKRDVLEKIGLLDETFYPAFYEDVDLCWRVREAGWRVVYEPTSVALHDEASSTRHHWPSRHYYHYRNRLLFLIKHYAVAQIVAEFVPAEHKRIEKLPLNELRAGQTALTEILVLVPTLPKLSSVSAEEIKVLTSGLKDLRVHIVQRAGGDAALRPPVARRESDNEQQDKTDPQVETTAEEAPETAPSTEEVFENEKLMEFDALLGELHALWEVEEQPFTSDIPVIGGIVVAFRKFWNSIATQWYVRPLLEQQIKFNGTVIRTLLHLQGRHRDLRVQHKKLKARHQDLWDHYWDDDALLFLLAEQCGIVRGHLLEVQEQLRLLETKHE